MRGLSSMRDNERPSRYAGTYADVAESSNLETQTGSRNRASKVAPDVALASSPVSRRGGSAREPAAHRVPSPELVYSDAWTAILLGEVRSALRTLPASSVDCVVTSPPYWGLRDYGLPGVVWGGKPDCDHRWNGRGETRCFDCGAWRGQLGLEPSYDGYVRHIVDVFR